MQQLIKEFLKAKKAEEKARDNRVRAEEAIAAAMGNMKLEGTTTREGDGYKISVTMKVNRKLDYEKYQSMKIPKPLQFIDMKPTLNLTAFRVAVQTMPEVAACITATPAKPSVKVEVAK